jgi:hypothetical protein
MIKYLWSLVEYPEVARMFHLPDWDRGRLACPRQRSSKAMNKPPNSQLRSLSPLVPTKIKN